MQRLQEIRDRIKTYFYDGHTVYQDIPYLLDALEQAQKEARIAKLRKHVVRREYLNISEANSKRINQIYDLEQEIKQSQDRERVLREALEQALHGLTTSHNLFATDRPDIMREKCPENIFWMTDNSKEVESVLKALKQEVIT